MDAAAQMFFTLSLGFGALISFASYMPMKNNCVRDAYTVVFINCGTSIFAAIVVFSILGHRELVTGNAADKVSILHPSYRIPGEKTLILVLREDSSCCHLRT